MIPAATIARLAMLGLTAEQTAAVAEMMAEVETATEAKANEAIEARRASDRARKERQRHGMSCDNTGQNGTDGTGNSDSPLPPKNYPKKTNSALAREARIDPDWEPSEADVAAVMDRGLPPDQLAAEVAACRDHHLGVGTSSDDFGALFRGWIRNGLRNAPRPARSPRGGQPARASPPPAVALDDGPRVNTPSGPRTVAFLLAQHRANRWSTMFGPKPGDAGCPIAAYLPKPSPSPALEPAE